MKGLLSFSLYSSRVTLEKDERKNVLVFIDESDAETRAVASQNSRRKGGGEKNCRWSQIFIILFKV